MAWRCLSCLKAVSQKLEMQDFALARQHVVVDAEAIHGFQMIFDDGIGDRGRKVRQLARAALDRMQGLMAPIESFGMFAEIRGNARVEVPAVVVEAHSWIVEEPFDVRGRFLLEVMECRHYVGNLDASVVDVILHFHRAAARFQHTHESVAQNGIAQVTDMGRFVGVDISVFDDDFAARSPRRLPHATQDSEAVCATIQADVDISVAGDFERGDTFHGAKSSYNFRRDDFRRLFQLPSQMKCNRDGELAEGRLLGLFERNSGLGAESGANQLGYPVRNFLFNEMKH